MTGIGSNLAKIVEIDDASSRNSPAICLQLFENADKSASDQTTTGANNAPEAEAEGFPAVLSAAWPGSAPAALPILLAEDNASNQTLVSVILGQAGYRLDVVENGVDAVSAVEAGEYGLVLMDSQMPLMDGLEAARRIRGLGGAKGAVPIVAMTADAMTGAERRYLEAGMTGYVSKPIAARELLAVVARYVLTSPA
jgi:CheY-like chemotaxis protein